MLRRLPLLTTLALLLGIVVAAPARADFIDTLNGHNLDIFTKGQSTATHADDNGDCYIAVAADLHRRFDSPDDEAALAVRGAGRVSKGDCAVRVQVDKIRVGSEGGPTSWTTAGSAWPAWRRARRATVARARAPTARAISWSSSDPGSAPTRCAARAHGRDTAAGRTLGVDSGSR